MNVPCKLLIDLIKLLFFLLLLLPTSSTTLPIETLKYILFDVEFANEKKKLLFLPLGKKNDNNNKKKLKYLYAPLYFNIIIKKN